jgi:hypothetical protein
MKVRSVPLSSCSFDPKNARKHYGMPAYCDAIVQRWENLTGKKAVLSDG